MADASRRPLAPQPRSTTPPPSDIERRIIRAVVGVPVILLMARTSADPDLWGHVRFGSDILSNGIHKSEPYSFTSDIPWINHEWLAEVAFAVAWAGAGSAGLVALKMLLVLGTAVVVWDVLRRAWVSPVLIDLLLLLVVFGTWPRTAVVRPQLFSVFLFAVLLWLLQSADRGVAQRLFWLPLVFVAWINLHGGWIVGFGASSFWLMTKAVSTPRRLPAATLILVGGLSLGALFVNPFGWDMLRFITETVAFSRDRIADWQPIERATFLFGLWSLSAAVSLYVLVRRRAAVPIYQAAIVVGLGIVALRVSRLDAFFAIAAVMLLGPHLGSANAPRLRSEWRLEPAVAGVVTALGILATIGMPEPMLCLRADSAPWTPEREAGAFIKANQLEGRLLSWFNWGEYAIWHFGPELLVSMDGRRETVYSESFLKAHTDLYYEPEQNVEMLPRLNADYAWLPIDLPLARTLETQGWTTIFAGSKSVVFSRQPGFFVDPPVQIGPACFPGP